MKPATMTAKERADCLARAEAAFPSPNGPRRNMAHALLNPANDGGIPMERLAWLAVGLGGPPPEGNGGASYRGFVENFRDLDKRSKAPGKRSASAMRNSLTAIQAGINQAGFDLTWDSVTLKSIVRVVPLAKREQRGAYVIKVGKQEIPNHLFCAIETADEKLYLSGVRVAGVWKAPPGMVRDYAGWAGTHAEVGHLFATPKKPFRAPKLGRGMVSPKVDREAAWNGRCWGCEKVEVVERGQGAGKLVQLGVSRVMFRDFAVLADHVFLLPPPHKISPWDYLQAHPTLSGGVLAGVHAAHAMIFLNVVVVLPHAGIGEKPLVVVCRHVDRHHFYQSDRNEYWSTAGESLAVSMRLQEDPRGVDFTMQVVRILQRQMGLEAHIGYTPRWLGAGYNKQYSRVEFFALVEIEATAEQIGMIFDHRENRFWENRICLLNLTDVARALNKTGRPLEKLINTDRKLISESLPTALALYLATEKEARVIRQAPRVE